MVRVYVFVNFYCTSFFNSDCQVGGCGTFQWLGVQMEPEVEEMFEDLVQARKDAEEREGHYLEKYVEASRKNDKLAAKIKHFKFLFLKMFASMFVVAIAVSVVIVMMS